jgi:hypothetical protein
MLARVSIITTRADVMQHTEEVRGKWRQPKAEIPPDQPAATTGMDADP